MGDLVLDPTIGNIAFGAGKDQWAFTLRTFANIYSRKTGAPVEKLMKRLWGDNYYDVEAKKWKTEPISETGQPLKRAFVQLILDPILEVFQAIMSNNREAINKKIEQHQINLT